MDVCTADLDIHFGVLFSRGIIFINENSTKRNIKYKVKYHPQGGGTQTAYA